MYNHRVHGQTPTRSMLASFAEPIMLASNTSSHCVDRTRPSLSARCHKPSNICATTKWQERRRHNRCHELPPAPPSPPVPKLSYPNHLNLAPHDLTGIFARPANGDAAARKYAEWTRKACEADGIQFELRECDKVELPQRLAEANEDPAVHGIMIYYPCFGAVPSFDGRSMDDSLRDAVAVEKDVEGLCHTYRRALFHDERFLRYLDGTTSERKCVLPCTPLAIVKILEHLKVYDEQLPVGGRMSGKIVTVINRSEIVGRPVAAMLANDGADVYSVDIDSIYLMRKGQMIATELTPEEVCKKSQVIITGVPVKSYQLPTEWVQPNTCVVNVPLVGKVTVAMLERNLIRLVENYHDPNAVEKVKVIEAGGRLVKL
jgi:methylenetetrahydrofolate dehydrogenase (NAD+)